MFPCWWPNATRPQAIVITLAHGDRVGIRYLDNGVKVYYAPLVPFVQGVAFPAFVDFMPLFRSIVLREGVTIVHGHQVMPVTMLDACCAETLLHRPHPHSRTNAWHTLACCRSRCACSLQCSRTNVNARLVYVYSLVCMRSVCLPRTLFFRRRTLPGLFWCHFGSLVTTLPSLNCAPSLYSRNCSILLNKVQQFTLCDTDHVICVSYAWYGSTILLCLRHFVMIVPRA